MSGYLQHCKTGSCRPYKLQIEYARTGQYYPGRRINSRLGDFPYQYKYYWGYPYGFNFRSKTIDNATYNRYANPPSYSYYAWSPSANIDYPIANTELLHLLYGDDSGFYPGACMTQDGECIGGVSRWTCAHLREGSTFVPYGSCERLSYTPNTYSYYHPTLNIPTSGATRYAGAYRA